MSTRRDDLVETQHGRAVADPYRWLEDAGDPAVQAWMDEHDRRARAVLGDLPGRAELAARLEQLFYYDAVSPPARRGGRFFYTRRHRDKEKAVVYWKAGEDGAEQVLFDPNTLSDDGSVSLGVWVPSEDGRRVAYALRRNNADAATLYVRDVDSGADLPGDVIDGAKYAYPSWTPDGGGFYYTALPTDPSIPIAELPGRAEVRFHRLGDDPAGDRLVHPASGDPQTFLDGSLSRDGRFLVLSLQRGWVATDVWVRDLAAGDTDFRPLAVGRGAQFRVGGFAGRLYVLTDEGAPRYRLFAVDPDALDRASWRELVAERADTIIEGAQVVGGHLVLTCLRDATSLLEVRSLDGALVREVALPGLGSVAGMLGNDDEDEAYFSYSSFTEVPQVYRTSIATGATELWARIEFPVDTGALAAEQVWYTSRDGTRVSMFILRRADARRSGDNPTVLYGYGGFNVSLTPAFGPGSIPWLEAGGVVAIPNLRGGGEYGEDWHRAGMLEHKQNVFDDFIAAAEHLFATGWTCPERLAVRGGSNGGLLVSAVMTQRPELFRAVVCAVPLCDMLRYHLVGSGKTWMPEYGDPDDPRLFAALAAYSPYHRVAPGTPYPALLMLSADSDDRVDPMHARKFYAAVAHASASGLPALLRIERNAGHGGADLVARLVEEAADSYAFLRWQLGA